MRRSTRPFSASTRPMMFSRRMSRVMSLCLPGRENGLRNRRRLGSTGRDVKPGTATVPPRTRLRPISATNAVNVDGAIDDGGRQAEVAEGGGDLSHLADPAAGAARHRRQAAENAGSDTTVGELAPEGIAQAESAGGDEELGPDGGRALG